MADEQAQGQEPSAFPAGQAPVAPSAPPVDAPKTFDEKYVTELREEAAGYRKQLRETQAALKELQTQAGETPKLAEKLTALEAQLGEATRKAEAAERLATATRIGAKAGVDADIIALLDLSKLDLTDEKKALETLSRLASKPAGSQARPGATGQSADDLHAYFWGAPRTSTIFGG